MKSAAHTIALALFLGNASASAVADETFGKSYSQCQTFASKFANTCSSQTAQIAFSAIPKQTLSCTDVNKCGGTESGNTCSFDRQLCVTCFQQSGDTYIHVQTNNIPNHCFYSQINELNPQEIDFKVKWMSNSYNDWKYTEQGALNEFVCDIMGSDAKTVPAGCDLTFTSGERDMGVAWGIATSGVALFTAAALTGVDPFYPAAYASSAGVVTDVAAAVEGADQCLWHPSPQLAGHYHSPPPCLANPSLVDNKSNFQGDIKAHMETNWLNIPYQSALGVSKDGRPIYTPYNGNGQKRENCDVDICNGFTDSNGNYAYQSTFHHPYFLGCFGKGNSPQLYQQCTSNPRLCNLEYLDGALAGISAGAAVAATTLLALTLY